MPTSQSASWKPIMPRPTGRCLRLLSPGLRDRVVVEVDHVVEHPHGDADRLAQLLVVDAGRR